jgi:hypothetical protein
MARSIGIMYAVDEVNETGQIAKLGGVCLGGYGTPESFRARKQAQLDTAREALLAEGEEPGPKVVVRAWEATTEDLVGPSLLKLAGFRSYSEPGPEKRRQILLEMQEAGTFTPKHGFSLEPEPTKAKRGVIGVWSAADQLDESGQIAVLGKALADTCYSRGDVVRTENARADGTLLREWPVRPEDVAGPELRRLCGLKPDPSPAKRKAILREMAITGIFTPAGATRLPAPQGAE